MSYNQENYKKIRAEYAGKNLRAKEAAEQLRDRLHKELPDLAEIDEALARTGPRIMQAAARFKGDRLENEIAAIRAENKELQSAREDCLRYHGYPSDYTDVKYECKECMDTGFIGTRMCGCMKKKLILAGFESSGIGHLISKQSFETFNPEYQREDKNAYETCLANLEICKKYAADFDGKSCRNLVLMGNTGLGKTHLSTSIAKYVIEHGFDVVYDSVQNILSDFENERFNRSYNGDPVSTKRYFDCDLLIIDDLGTEISNQFTVSVIYNIINTRFNNDKSTIINTNLSQQELRSRYTDRVASRIFGEYAPLIFLGGDVRAKKLY